MNSVNVFAVSAGVIFHSLLNESVFVVGDDAVVFVVSDEGLIGEVAVFRNLAVGVVVVEVAVEKIVHNEVAFERGVMFGLFFAVVEQIFKIERVLRRFCNDVGENIGQNKTESR